MKKAFVVLLFVLLVSALLVSCKEEPEVIDNSVCKITVSGFTDPEELKFNATYYLKAGYGEYDLDDPEYYKLYTDLACTNEYDEYGENFCINTSDYKLDDVELPACCLNFIDYPALDIHPISSSYAFVKFTAGSVFEASKDEIKAKLEFTKDITLMCYVYDN